MPLPAVCAALQSLKILQQDKSLRERLFKNVDYVRKELSRRGLVLPATPGPIIAAKPGTKASALRIARELLKAGIYPSLISYPGGPVGGYFRFVVSSEHTHRQLQALVNVLVDVEVTPVDAEVTRLQ